MKVLALLLVVAVAGRAAGFAATEDEFEILGQSAGVGDSIEVPVHLNLVSDVEVVGFQMAVCNSEDDVLSVEEVNAGSALSGWFAGEGSGFFGASLSGEGFGSGDWTVGVIFSYTGAHVLTNVEETYELVSCKYSALAEGEATLSFCSTLGDPVIPNIFVYDASEEGTPALIDAEITVSTGSLFLRGDVDGNGSVSGINDALFLLDYGYQGGGAPPCQSAADADGNNVVSPLADTLFLLRWAFSGGSEPPEPGPNDCGADSDKDDLTCETQVCA